MVLLWLSRQWPCDLQAGLNLDASVSRMGFYGEQQELLWCLSHTDTFHLWQWQAACNEESQGADALVSLL